MGANHPLQETNDERNIGVKSKSWVLCAQRNRPPGEGPPAKVLSESIGVGEMGKASGSGRKSGEKKGVVAEKISGVRALIPKWKRGGGPGGTGQYIEQGGERKNRGGGEVDTPGGDSR